MQVTIRKIANGYVVTLPATPGHLGPLPGHSTEHFCADLDVVMSTITDHFEPIPSNHNQE